ncbi:lamin tail domain-containing protein [Spongiactinospora sp. TRM90649]|uniref:lamin tail domain-containing protein n=1 Tax=Spongiactinospora sp. TRM90649 TaxID=3031114 RepID=UPI0023F99B4B|nr:lamin tail domain-containing protein [Spongiactinospora sp. TRM90649]MDF5758988.1 lamin tail domain-containing protein [Spongiactinospora sp. TRM90649]
MRHSVALGCAVVALAVLAPVSPAGATAAPKVMFTRVHFDSPGSDRGGNQSLNGEYAVIKNTTRSRINLEGWILRDANGFKYEFGPVALKAGKQLVIRSGQGDDTGTTVYWNRRWYVWNNDKDTATLYNVARRKVDQCSWRVSASSGPDYTLCR